MDYTLISMTLPMSAAGSIIGVNKIIIVENSQSLHLLIHRHHPFHHPSNLSKL